MCSKTLNYLPCKLKLQSTLLTFAAAIFLSACGVKGDLYQTPEQVELATDIAKMVVVETSDDKQDKNTKAQDEMANSMNKSELAQAKEQQ